LNTWVRQGVNSDVTVDRQLCFATRSVNSWQNKWQFKTVYFSKWILVTWKGMRSKLLCFVNTANKIYCSLFLQLFVCLLPFINPDNWCSTVPHFFIFKGLNWKCAIFVQVECSNGQTGYGRRRREVASIPADPNKVFEVTMSTYIRVDYKGDDLLEKGTRTSVLMMLLHIMRCWLLMIQEYQCT
jgi:hypothetical protein